MKRLFFPLFTDPYVKLNLYHVGMRVAKWKTTVRKKTLIPVFNESFQLDISGTPNTKALTLEIVVMDYDRLSRNDVIGFTYLGENVGCELGREHWKEVMDSPEQAVSHWHPLMAPQLAKKQSQVGVGSVH